MADTGIKTTIGWVIGVSTIALTLLVILIVFGNLSGNMGFTSTTTTTYTNESAYLNLSRGAYPLTHMSDSYALSYVISEVGANVSEVGAYKILTSGNYTLSGNTIVNATSITGTEYNYSDIGITYVVTYNGDNYIEAEGVINNVSSGINKLVTQFPTILLFVGIGLLLFVLIGVLAYVIRKMSGLGGSNKGTMD